MLVVAIVVALTGCGSGSTHEIENQSSDQRIAIPTDLDSWSLQDQIVFLVENSYYEEALVRLRRHDESDLQIRQMLIATHMTYGIELTYGSLTDQRTRMPEALRHYRRVLELDPENERAMAEIRQIEDIYRSLNREIPEGIAR